MDDNFLTLTSCFTLNKYSQIEKPLANKSAFHRWVNQLSMTKKILIGFSLPLCFLLFVANDVYFSARELIATNDQLNETQAVINQSQRLGKLIVDMETGERGFLITGKDTFLEPLDKARSLWPEAIAQLKELVKQQPVQTERIQQIEMLIEQWHEMAAQPEIELRRKVQSTQKSLEHIQHVLRRKTGKNLLDEMRQIIKSIADEFNLAEQHHGTNLLLILSKSMVEQESGQRGYLITGVDYYLNQFNQGKGEFKRTMSELKSLAYSGYSKQQALSTIDVINQMSQQWLTEIAKPTISHRQSNTPKGKKFSPTIGSETLEYISMRLEELNDLFVKAEFEQGQLYVLKLSKDFADMQTGFRGYILTGQQQFLQPYEQASQRWYEHIEQFKVLISKNFDKEQVVAQLLQLYDRHIQWHDLAAKPEIDARQEINIKDVSTLEFLQSTFDQVTHQKELENTYLGLNQVAQQFAEEEFFQGHLLSSELFKGLLQQQNLRWEFLISGDDDKLKQLMQQRQSFRTLMIQLLLSVESDYKGQDKQQLLSDLSKIDLGAAAWFNHTALMEVKNRKEVGQNNPNTLTYIQGTLRKGIGKNMAIEIRQLLQRMATEFSRSNNIQGENIVYSLAKAMADQETGKLGFLITGQQSFLAPYNEGRRTINQLIPQLRNTVKNSYDVQLSLEKVSQVEGLVRQWIEVVSHQNLKKIAMVDSNQNSAMEFENVITESKSNELLDNIRKILADLDGVFQLAENAHGQALSMAMIRDIVEMEAGQRGFLISSDDSYLRQFEVAKQDIYQRLGDVEHLVKQGLDIAMMLDCIEQFRAKSELWIEKSAQPEIDLRLKLNEHGTSMADVTALIENETGKKIIDQVRQILLDFIAHANYSISKRSLASVEAANKVKTSIIIGIGLSVLFSFMAAYWVRQLIVGSSKQLLYATQRIINGDYTTQITMESQDELGELAKTFNQMSEKLVESQDKLVESSKMASLGHMAAGIAHELNQPLGVISLNSENMALCLDRQMYSQAAQLSEKNVEQVKRASKIINALRQFSREENGEQRVPCSLNQLIENMVTLNVNELHLHEVKLSLELAENMPNIMVSPVQIEQVISNIILNARDALQDSDKKLITIKSFIKQNKVVVEITDTGVGMTQENKSRIFDPFFTTKAIGKGTGLGLSLSYAMLESNGGSIKVESQIEVGTTFTISFNHDNEGAQ